MVSFTPDAEKTKEIKASVLDRLVREEEAMMTPNQRFLRQMGYTESDTIASHESIGAMGVCMIIGTAAVIIGSDLMILRRHFLDLFLKNVRGH